MAFDKIYKVEGDACQNIIPYEVTMNFNAFCFFMNIGFEAPLIALVLSPYNGVGEERE